MKYHVGQRVARHDWASKLLVAIFMIAVLVFGRAYVSQSLTSEANDSPLVNAETVPLEERPITEFSEQAPVESIEGNTSTQLQSLLDQVAAEYPEATISVAITALDGSFEASLIPQHSFDAASLYKTLAAYAVLQQVDAGELNLNRIIDGSTTLRTCIRKALTISDNDCGVALQTQANPYELDTQLIDWGYVQTTISGEYPQTSARDQVQLMQDIYRGERLSSSSKRTLLSHLSDQRILNRTPDYGEDTTLYLKTGDLDGTVHSSAIVETETQTYAIAILTDNWDLDILSKYATMRQLSQAVHGVINNE